MMQKWSSEVEVEAEAAANSYNMLEVATHLQASKRL